MQGLTMVTSRSAHSVSRRPRLPQSAPLVAAGLEQWPLGLNAGDTNLYRYVFNNPASLLDPTGLGTEFRYRNAVAPEFAVDKGHRAGYEFQITITFPTEMRPKAKQGYFLQLNTIETLVLTKDKKWRCSTCLYRRRRESRENPVDLQRQTSGA